MEIHSTIPDSLPHRAVHGVVSTLSVLAILAAPLAAAANTQTPTQALLSACPEQWQLLNAEIQPDQAGAIWADAADRGAFREYYDRYQFDKTTASTQFDALADDPLTVASECVLRRNKVTDDSFGKVIDNVTAWAKKVNVAAIILLLLND